jgi:hypothetical protein
MLTRWHIANNPAAPTFVGYWTKADKSGFRPATVYPLMTQSGHKRRKCPKDLYDMLVLGLFGALLAYGKKLHNLAGDKA